MNFATQISCYFTQQTSVHQGPRLPTGYKSVIPSDISKRKYFLGDMKVKLITHNIIIMTFKKIMKISRLGFGQEKNCGQIHEPTSRLFSIEINPQEPISIMSTLFRTMIQHLCLCCVSLHFHKSFAFNLPIYHLTHLVIATQAQNLRKL